MHNSYRATVISRRLRLVRVSNRVILTGSSSTEREHRSSTHAQQGLALAEPSVERAVGDVSTLPIDPLEETTFQATNGVVALRFARFADEVARARGRRVNVATCQVANSGRAGMKNLSLIIVSHRRGALHYYVPISPFLNLRVPFRWIAIHDFS